VSSKRNHSIDLPYDFFTQNIFSLNLSVFAPLREDSFNLLFFYLSAFAPLREDSFDLLFFYLSAFVYPVGPEDRTGAPLREDSFNLSFFYLSVFAPLRETIYLIFHFFISAPLRLCVRIHLIFHFFTSQRLCVRYLIYELRVKRRLDPIFCQVMFDKFLNFCHRLTRTKQYCVVSAKFTQLNPFLHLFNRGNDFFCPAMPAFCHPTMLMSPLITLNQTSF